MVDCGPGSTGAATQRGGAVLRLRPSPAP
jgi:hypothetical protein